MTIKTVFSTVVIGVLAVIPIKSLEAQESVEIQSNPIEKMVPQPILVSWHGQAFLRNRNQAPLGNVIQDSTSFKQLWKSWHSAKEKAPNIDFDHLIAIVNFGSTSNELGVGMRLGQNGDLDWSLVTNAMKIHNYSTFSYQISIVSRRHLKSVQGQSLFAHGLLRANQLEKNKQFEAAIELYSRLIKDPQIVGEENRVAALLRWRARRVLAEQNEIMQDLADAKLAGHQGLLCRIPTPETELLDDESIPVARVKQDDQVLITNAKAEMLWVAATNNQKSKSGWIDAAHLTSLMNDFESMMTAGVGKIQQNQLAKGSILTGSNSVQKLISELTKKNQSREALVAKDNREWLAYVKKKKEEYERGAAGRAELRRKAIEYIRKNNLEHILEKEGISIEDEK